MVRYTDSEDLASNTIRSIQEDSLGRIFIGTPAGVSMYAEGSFITVPVERSLNAMWQSAPGDLWFSCNASANDVYRYDGERLYQLRLPRQDFLTSRYKVLTDSSYEKLPGVELANHDTDIKLPFFMSGVVDADATLWMVSYGAGVWKYDGKAFTQQYIEEAGVEVLIISIYKDRSDNLWLCTDNAGVWVQKDGVFVKFEF